MTKREKIRFYLMFAAPNLEAVSRMLASQDADETGTDDDAARILHFSSLSINAIINDRPLPDFEEFAAEERAIQARGKVTRTFPPDRTAIEFESELAARQTENAPPLFRDDVFRQKLATQVVEPNPNSTVK